MASQDETPTPRAHRSATVRYIEDGVSPRDISDRLLTAERGRLATTPRLDTNRARHIALMRQVVDLFVALYDAAERAGQPVASETLREFVAFKIACQIVLTHEHVPELPGER